MSVSLLLCSGGGVRVHEWSLYKQGTDLGPLLQQDAKHKMRAKLVSEQQPYSENNELC